LEVVKKVIIKCMNGNGEGVAGEGRVGRKKMK
jgi:hypothetical protein